MKFLPRSAAAVLAVCATLSLASQSASAADPAPVDKSIPKTNLPTAQAFLDGNPADLAKAVAYCESGPTACSFTVDINSTFRYYDRARVVGDTFVNCTRNTLERTRHLSYNEDAFDNVSNTQADLFPHPVLARRDNTGPMAHQFETALTYTDGRWSWVSSDQREIVERIDPGEVSWVELQPARKRVYGSFTATGEDAPAWRIDAIVDSPTRLMPDRLLQRTGPMTVAEKERCAASRPATTTPAGSDAPTR
ncbi:hypothetical protein [Streptomyces longhuiensis]|uniref:hypothetical protein n=1 Tax=Streptomyces TaxID=1883 RepID=UPI001D0B6104|nr:hypothetical protein [Streptomyces longhuiensis]UDM04745.1 hypothetical protein LGI35_44235 [Streptomyces longhuiensis]